jgi:tryptophan synthase alpha chain
MNPIDSVFGALKSSRAKAFIPFLTAGDPDVETTAALATALIDSGANLLEIGFPYSDPIADGPVIQASYTRALDRGLTIDDVFRCARRIADANNERVPLVAMVSWSLVYRRNPDDFIRKARESGFSGAIVPDLPLEESAGLSDVTARHDFKLIFMVTPTTSRPRAIQIVKRATGFVYCVSVAGITGERTALPTELLEQLSWLRQQTDLPLCVGFGISKPEHVHMLRDHCDGIIVGSAFVRQVEAKTPVAELQTRLSSLARTLRAALDEPVTNRS